MSKAILVIDMPENCSMCRMATLVERNTVMCTIDRLTTRTYADACKNRPDWCPLKEMPQKPDYPPIDESSFVAGYNACIDEILEGSEEDE